VHKLEIISSKVQFWHTL